jgi:hypothetical protein
MIPDEKQYEFLTSQIAARDQKAVDTYFKLFLQFFSAIVGGSIWLSLQKGIKSEDRLIYVTLSDVLVAILAVVSVALVVENFRAWWGYRRALSRLVGKTDAGENIVPLPKVFPAAIMETIVGCAMLIACASFLWFNPFLFVSN